MLAIAIVWCVVSTASRPSFNPLPRDALPELCDLYLCYVPASQVSGASGTDMGAVFTFGARGCTSTTAIGQMISRMEKVLHSLATAPHIR